MKHLPLIGALTIACIVLVGCQSTTPQNTYDADSRKTTIPAECQQFFDGCNQCQRTNNGVACTKIYCEEYEAPQCLDEEAEIFETDSLSNTEMIEIRERYIGLTSDEAKKLADDENTTFRVVVIDGIEQPATLDYIPGRINATIENNLVTELTIE